MEKTFEELFYDKIGNFDTEHHELIEKWEFIEFCKQVREATIAECADIELDSCSSVETQRRFDTLLTDRIFN